MAPLGDVTNQTVVLRTFFSEDGLQTTVTIEHPDRLSMRDVRKLAATALNDKLEPMGRGRPVQPNNSTLLPPPAPNQTFKEWASTTKGQGVFVGQRHPNEGSWIAAAAPAHDTSAQLAEVVAVLRTMKGRMATMESQMETLQKTNDGLEATCAPICVKIWTRALLDLSRTKMVQDLGLSADAAPWDIRAAMRSTPNKRLGKLSASFVEQALGPKEKATLREDGNAAAPTFGPDEVKQLLHHLHMFDDARPIVEEAINYVFPRFDHL